MKKMLIMLAACATVLTAAAQVGTAAKEAGKATADTAKQGVQATEGALTSEPKSSMHKAEAQADKQMAAHHAKKAKKAASNATK